MKEFDFINGEVLLINKPYRWTSFDAVSYIRKSIINKLGLKKIKIGHAGTLDPLASGLLILCTGAFTKNIDQFQNLEKEYTGTFTLGAITASGDLEKEVIQKADITNLEEQCIRNAIKLFTGEIQQKAPVFSAKKIKGKRAYEYARNGEEVEIKANTVFVKELEITNINLPEVEFRIVCSKGTYIRSLAIDIGEELGVGAYLSALCRTKIGEFKLEDAMKPEDIKKIIENLNNTTSN